MPQPSPNQASLSLYESLTPPRPSNPSMTGEFETWLRQREITKGMGFLSSRGEGYGGIGGREDIRNNFLRGGTPPQIPPFNPPRYPPYWGDQPAPIRPPDVIEDAEDIPTPPFDDPDPPPNTTPPFHDPGPGGRIGWYPWWPPHDDDDPVEVSSSAAASSSGSAGSSGAASSSAPTSDSTSLGG